MSFVKSILVGSPGEYEFCGISIEMTVNPNRAWYLQPALKVLQSDGWSSLLPKKNEGKLEAFTRGICRVAHLLSGTPLWHAVTLRYSQELIHELGHAIAAKILISRSHPTIYIETNTTNGETNIKNPTGWKLTACLLAGPMASLGFSVARIAAAAMMKQNGFRWPCVVLLGMGGVQGVLHELKYALNPPPKEKGDWTQIAEQGKTSLGAALFIAQLALGAFAVMKCRA